MHKVVQNFKPIYLDKALEKPDHLFNNRQEEKFIVPQDKVVDILNFLKGSFLCKYCDDGFIFKYKNTYFDTNDYRFFEMHRQGKYNRLKVRIREYENGVPGRYLECKEKRKGIKSKKKRKVISEGQSYQEPLESDYLGEVLERYDIQPSMLQPMIDIHYSRLHFVSQVESVRVTLDFDLRANTPGEDSVRFLPDHFIMELKYAHLPKDLFRFLRREHGLVPQSFSKYCVSMCVLNRELKRNKWKQIFKKYIHEND